MQEEEITQEMTFEETLGALLEMVGSPVKVMLSDRSSQMYSVVTCGTLTRGQEVLGQVVDTSAVVFQLGDGEHPGAFTITSKGFEGATWDALRGLHIHAADVQAWVMPLPLAEGPPDSPSEETLNSPS